MTQVVAVVASAFSYDELFVDLEGFINFGVRVIAH